jgi:hypothetical protein
VRERRATGSRQSCRRFHLTKKRDTSRQNVSCPTSLRIRDSSVLSRCSQPGF